MLMARLKENATTPALAPPTSWADAAGSLGSVGPVHAVPAATRSARERARAEQAFPLGGVFIFVPIASVWTSADHTIVKHFGGADLIETARVGKPDLARGENASRGKLNLGPLASRCFCICNATGLRPIGIVASRRHPLCHEVSIASDEE